MCCPSSTPVIVPLIVSGWLCSAAFTILSVLIASILRFALVSTFAVALAAVAVFPA